MKRYKFKVIIPLALSLFLTVVLLAVGFYKPQPGQNISPSPKLSQSVISDKIVASSPQSQTENLQLQKVARVIDGDTIELENGQKVRYIGINTPETVDPRKAAECFGKESSLKNRELVEGKSVRLEKDVSETDKYSRLLRYVYVDDALINDYLVRQGFAYASAFPPDVKYQDQFQNAQREAQQENRGLWSSCESGSSGITDQNATAENCQIKGNISSTGEKIYHVPGQRYYNQTVVDESKGERWFCSEDDAQQAGWRKSKI